MSSVRTTFSRRPEFLTGRSSRRTYTNEIEQNPPSTWVSATLRSLSPGPILLKAWLAFLLLAEKRDSPSVPNNNKIAPAKRNFALRGAVVIQGKKYPLGYSFHWADSFHCRRWFHSYFAKPSVCFLLGTDSVMVTPAPPHRSQYTRHHGRVLFLKWGSMLGSWNYHLVYYPEAGFIQPLITGNRRLSSVFRCLEEMGKRFTCPKLQFSDRQGWSLHWK